MPIKLTRRTLIRTGAAAATLPLIGAPAIAQGWPNKPIRFVVSYPAGGLTDIFARAYGDYISKQVGQTVVVENKAGAGGTVGALEVKRAAADGYTLLFTISTTMIMNKVLYKSLPYDPDKDFVLLSYMPSGSLPFVVNTGTGATNLKEFAEYAKKNKTNVRHLRGGLLRPHCDRRAEQAFRPEHGGRALSRRSADVDRPRRRIDPGGDRKLGGGARRAADRQGPGHRRVAG